MNRLFSQLAFVVVMFSLGCRSDKPDGFPKLQPVTITITQDGKPLANATINLFAQEESLQKWCPSGMTDDDGKASLISYGKYKGVATGKYKVTVTKVENVYEEKPNPHFADLGKRVKASYNLIEQIYTSEISTTLEVEVTSSSNHFKFDVGKPIKKSIKTI